MSKLKNCPYCGTLLRETTFGRIFCSNCGVIDEDTETKVDDDPSYIK